MSPFTFLLITERNVVKDQLDSMDHLDTTHIIDLDAADCLALSSSNTHRGRTR